MAILNSEKNGIITLLIGRVVSPEVDLNLPADLYNHCTVILMQIFPTISVINTSYTCIYKTLFNLLNQ